MRMTRNRTEEIGSYRKRVQKPFLYLYLASIILYSPLIILRLTNNMDGMWDQDDHVTGVAELRMGRWFWPILDKLRLNVSLDPLPAVVSLAIFTCGVLFLFSLMRIRMETKREKISAWVIGMLILASPTVLCQLSYSHMSINDSASFLLAILAVWLLREDEGGWKRILCSGLVTAMMMGGYQASLGITCVTALFVFIGMLRRKEKVRRALDFAGRMLLAILLGAALYEVFLHLGLAVTGQTLSDYNGADAITFTGVLGNLPASLRHTYTAFWFYFGGEGYHFNLLQSHGWFRLLYMVPFGIVVFCIWKIVRKSGREEEETCEDTKAGEGKRERFLRTVLMLAAFLLVPVFANSFFLLAVSAETMMQMTMGMALVLPLLFCLLAESSGLCKQAEEEKKHLKTGRRGVSAVAGIAFFLLLYGEAGQSVVDQYAMYVGRQATSTIAKQVMNQWAVAGTDYTENVVLVYGAPKQSPLFSVSDLFYRANSYAQYGTWASTPEGNRLCWFHFFEQQLRVNVNYAEGDTLETIYNSPEVAAMPVYPAPGSTANVWGVTVVKISE